MKKLFLISCVFSLFCAAGWAWAPSTTELQREKSQKQSTTPSSEKSFKNSPFITLNRCGYVAANNLSSPQPLSVTDVSAEWVAPSTDSKDLYSGVAIFIGLGNLLLGSNHGRSGSLVQENHAFYVTPAGIITVDASDMPISSGDHLAARAFSSGTDYFIEFKNKTQKKIFQLTLPQSFFGTAIVQTAQWIVGDPRGLFGYFSLPDFGKITFKNCRATINGKTGSISNHAWEHAQFRMISTSDILKAKQSKLRDDGKEFDVVFKHN